MATFLIFDAASEEDEKLLVPRKMSLSDLSIEEDAPVCKSSSYELMKSVHYYE